MSSVQIEDDSAVDKLIAAGVCVSGFVHGAGVSLLIYSGTSPNPGTAHAPSGGIHLLYWSWLIWFAAYLFVGARPALLTVAGAVVGAIAWLIWFPGMLVGLGVALGGRM